MILPLQVTAVISEVSDSENSSFSPTKLSPFVFWAQTAGNVSLRISLQSVKNPLIDLTEKLLTFSAHGIGAKGFNEYQFQLKLFKDINPEEINCKVKEREVEIVLGKVERIWWPRLIHDQCKPAWLKVDFDNLKTEDDEYNDEDEYNDDEIQDLYKSLEDPNHKYSDFKWRGKRVSRKKVEDIRKIYLFIYNLFQFVGYLYILIVLCIKYTKEGPESIGNAYAAVSFAMKFCQLMQILEVLHPLLGYTSGSALMPFLQVSGKLIMIFAMIHSEPRMSLKPAVFYLFFIYSASEVVRYPYYMLKVYNAGISFLTWLRYTLWIPLYPFGFFCEGVIILRNIPYFEETRKFSVSLPNTWNFSFEFPAVMRLYLLCGLFPSLYFMMSHMYRQRVKILSEDEEFKNK